MPHADAGGGGCQAMLEGMDERVSGDVRALRTMLEEELERSLGRQSGCWPLFVGVLGVLLGAALLLGLL